MASKKRQALNRYRVEGTGADYSRVLRWSAGGSGPHLAALRRSRRLANKWGHAMTRFRRADKMVRDGDPDIYYAECRRCGADVIVCLRDGEERFAPHMSGGAVAEKFCEGR